MFFLTAFLCLGLLSPLLPLDGDNLFLMPILLYIVWTEVFASCSVLFCFWVHGPLVLPLAPLRSYFHVFFPASLPTYYPIFHPMSLPSTTLFLLHPSLPGRLISSPTTFTQRWEEGAHLLPPNVLPTYLFPGVSSLNNFFMHTP